MSSCFPNNKNYQENTSLLFGKGHSLLCREWRINSKKENKLK